MAKSVAGELFRFGVGAATARPSGVATAGTPGSISPTIRDRFRGGVEALSATQALRAGEAEVGRVQSQAELNRARIDKASQDIVDAGTQVDLSKVLGANFTAKRTAEIIDMAKRLGGDIDGNNVIDAKEFAKILPKIPPDFIESTISSGTQEARLVLEQNTALIEPLIKKANEVIGGGLTVDNAAEMFQNNPNLATTFPKIAEALQGQSAQQQKIDNLNQAGEMAKSIGKPTTRKFKVIKDELGNLVGVDPETLERFSVPRQEAERIFATQEDADVSPTGKRQPFITARELGKATGPLSGGAAFLSRAFGIFFPGEQFSSIQSARNKVRNLNKKIVQTLVLSKRFPVFEQAQIQGFLVDPSSFTADPGGASGKTLDFKEFILREKQGLENQLGQTISAEQRINISGKLGNINQVLNLLPGNLELKIASGREITIDDINNMTLSNIRDFPASEARFLSREIKLEMLSRLKAGQGVTSGGF